MRLTDRRIHMVGIGGTGMSSLTRLLLARGAKVWGSDTTATGVTAELARLGARVSIGHDPGNLPEDCDLVVATAAVNRSNPELREAYRRGLNVIKYARLLGLLMRDKLGIAVAGTHGKTTTSSMVVEILRSAGSRGTAHITTGRYATEKATIGAITKPVLGTRPLDSPSYVIGGKIIGHSGHDCAGQGEFLVAEACEYDRSFLNLRPTYAILTNLEPDHLDYYKSESSLIDAFGQFVSLLPGRGLLVVNSDSHRALRAASRAKCRLRTFGVGEGCDWRIATIETRSEGYAFELRRGTTRFEFELRVPGQHNVLNAAAAAVLALNLGVCASAVADGLAGFRGVERRFQVLTNGLPVTVIDDYAHHPTEVSAVLRAARERYPGSRVWAVFQAHQHSRTRIFFEKFARSLTYADRVIVAKIFSVRETNMDRKSVSGADIAGRLFQLSVRADYVPEFDAIQSLLLGEVRQGDVVVVMGAGDIYKVAHSLAGSLRERHKCEIPGVKTAV